MPKRVIRKAVTWLSEEIASEQKISNSFRYYEKFQFKKIVGEIGNFVLISNADSSEPDTESGCDVARIVALYEDRSNKNDPFRAKVQWYSRPGDLPSSYFTKAEPYTFLEREVIEDHRPFDADVSIETFFTKCNITFTFTKDTDVKTDVLYNYICRYRLMAVTKRKVNIEPVLEEERKAIELLSTPNKTLTPKTPNSLIKRLGRISISEQNNWSISKQDGSKILLKRAILADKIEKDSPKKLTPKTTPKKVQTPKSNKKLTSNEIEKVLSMELQENSDEELPTLIIRQHVPTTPRRRDSSDEELPTLIIRQHTPTTPKRKSVSRSKEDTPKRMLFRTNDKETCTCSGRASRKPVNYLEEELSPVKRTPRSNELIISKKSTLPEDDSDDDCLVSKTKIDRYTETSSIKRTARRLRNMSTDDDEIRTPKRSTRSRTPNLVNYIEDELSPVKKTPRALRKTTEADEFKRTPKKNTIVTEDSDDDDFKPMPKTPKTPRTPRVTPGRTPKRSNTKKILTSQLTPSLRNRAHSVDNIDEFIKENKSLPGREQQMEEILSFVRTKLLDETSGCIYISGVPGTGKTATVCSALQILKEEPGLPDFHLVEVNGMRIAEPRQAYVQIYKQLTGKTVLWEQACSLLEKVFNNPRPRRTPTVLLVDEASGIVQSIQLDALCTRRQDVLYSIMEWAAHSSALLTVLAVANTMDLPERALASRVASRLGLTRLTFPPYTHTQLQRIVLARLAGERVTADALQLVARKVAAVSGDARRALSLCSRALELAGADGAGLREVQLALSEASSSAAVRAIQSCAPAERLMLRAVAAEVERTGSDETTLSRALTTAAAIVALDGRPYRSASHVRAPRPAQARAACARLAAARLLLLEPRPGEPRLLLNVSADDVHYATRQITV